MHKLAACLSCNWFHVSVDKSFVENWKKEWAEYWPTLDKEGRESFGVEDGPPSEKIYESCFRCGNPHSNFRDAHNSEVPSGTTMQSILDRNE